MTLAEISRLAELSRTMRSVGDNYADMRCKWCVDPANTGKDMWWGEDQPYYRFLYLIAKNHPGGMAIEVGTHAGIGFSCLAAGALASGNPKGWTIGIDKDNHGSAIEVATKYTECMFINGRSIAPETVQIIEDICKKEDIKINIMFIDATHTLSWVNEELKAYRHLFSDKVVLIFDDIIKADNNTKLPECFDAIPGEKARFPGLHTDNCIAISLSSKDQFVGWNPPAPTRLEY
jgi:cephalosporin hydroxylase